MQQGDERGQLKPRVDSPEEPGGILYHNAGRRKARGGDDGKRIRKKSTSSEPRECSQMSRGTAHAQKKKNEISEPENKNAKIVASH